jgi:hypothetical protein
MRINEIVDVQAQLELWKLVSTSVWQAIEQQSAEQERAQAAAAQQRALKKTSKASKRGAGAKPTASVSVKLPNVSPQPKHKPAQSKSKLDQSKQPQYKTQLKRTDVNADVGNTQMQPSAMPQPTPSNLSANPQLITKQKAEPPQLASAAAPASQHQAPATSTQNTQAIAPKRTPIMRQTMRKAGV